MTQNGRLLNWLETHPGGITQLEAFNTLGICRLSERIREIEALDYIIEHRPEKTNGGARIVRYKLVSCPHVWGTVTVTLDEFRKMYPAT